MSLTPNHLNRNTNIEHNPIVSNYAVYMTCFGHFWLTLQTTFSQPQQHSADQSDLDDAAKWKHTGRAVDLRNIQY